MSVYCTIQEAWGSNFGRRQSFFPGGPNSRNARDSIDSREGFDGSVPQRNPPHEQVQEVHHSSTNPSRQCRNSEENIGKPRLFKAPEDERKRSPFRLQSSYDYDEFNVPLAAIPQSHDYRENRASPQQYYDFRDKDCAKEEQRVLNYIDAIEEEQLFPVKPLPKKPKPPQDRDLLPIHPTRPIDHGVKTEDNAELMELALCHEAVSHVFKCKQCQELVSKMRGDVHGKHLADSSLKHKDAEEEADEEERFEGGDEGDMEFNEILLFIICGIFFIFLLDSLVNFGKRFG